MLTAGDKVYGLIVYRWDMRSSDHVVEWVDTYTEKSERNDAMKRATERGLICEPFESILDETNNPRTRREMAERSGNEEAD